MKSKCLELTQKTIVRAAFRSGYYRTSSVLRFGSNFTEIHPIWPGRDKTKPVIFSSFYGPTISHAWCSISITTGIALNAECPWVCRVYSVGHSANNHFAECLWHSTNMPIPVVYDAKILTIPRFLMNHRRLGTLLDATRVPWLLLDARGHTSLHLTRHCCHLHLDFILILSGYQSEFDPIRWDTKFFEKRIPESCL